MRRLAPADLSVAARALLLLPELAREAAIGRMLAEAEAADRFCKRLGTCHPLWGNGTLEAAARRRPLAAPVTLSDNDYLACLALVLDLLLAHRRPTHRRA